MKFSKVELGAIVAGLFTPALYFLVKDKFKDMEQTSVAYKNMRAFLIMIQYAEGTFGQNAYRTLFGGGLFNDFSKHPNARITRGRITSTAAGAYQILNKTWLEMSKKLGLSDFSPQSQDRVAVELIRRRKALEDVYAGRFLIAIEKCKKEWASLPGAGYNQRERSPTSLLSVYKIAGGSVLNA